VALNRLATAVGVTTIRSEFATAKRPQVAG